MTSVTSVVHGFCGTQIWHGDYSPEGATPAEAVSWGKIDPDRLPDAVVCYLNGTFALPLLTSKSA